MLAFNHSFFILKSVSFLFNQYFANLTSFIVLKDPGHWRLLFSHNGAWSKAHFCAKYFVLISGPSFYNHNLGGWCPNVMQRYWYLSFFYHFHDSDWSQLWMIFRVNLTIKRVNLVIWKVRATFGGSLPPPAQPTASIQLSPHASASFIQVHRFYLVLGPIFQCKKFIK